MTRGPSDRALGLVAAVARAAAAAHTAATLGQQVADAVGQSIPLRYLELSLPGEVARRFVPARETAREGGGGAEIVVTLGLGARAEGAACRLAVGWSEARLAQEVGWGAPLQEALGAVVAAAVAQLRALGRVAALSRRAHGERARLVEELDQAVLPREVVAASPAMRRLFFETIPLIAGHDATVLLRGETGTGKEVAARRIHALSPRARRPFVRVNCGALPEALAESLLFGHERGAFTGAHQRHTGVFERASGGTLLLDEVGELSLAMQARLLRVIQEGEFERVGGVEAVRVDLRLIAATHRDLEGMMAEGKFRQDLYYRLHVVPIELPPLRERIEDIEGLVRETLRRLADRAGRAPPPVSAHDLERLRSWPWPGNVRELENLLERALVLSPGERIVLPMSFGPLPGRAAESTPAEGPRPAGARAATSPGEVARGASEAGGFDGGVRRLIEGALEASGGRIHGAGGAAERLGLRPTTLQAKMRKLGVKRSR